MPPNVGITRRCWQAWAAVGLMAQRAYMNRAQGGGCASSVAYIHPYPGGYSPPENPYHSGIREEFSGCGVGWHTAVAVCGTSHDGKRMLVYFAERDAGLGLRFPAQKGLPFMGQRCPSCHSHAVTVVFAGDGLACQSCGRITQRADARVPRDQSARSQAVHVAREQLWRRVNRGLWFTASVIYHLLLLLFLASPIPQAPLNIGVGIGLYLLAGLGIIPSLWFFLSIFAMGGFNWLVVYTDDERRLGVIGVLRGVLVLPLGFLGAALLRPFPIHDGIKQLILLPVFVLWHYVGPPATRQQLDVLIGFLISLAILFVLIIR
jgi:hypothetical protein